MSVNVSNVGGPLALLAGGYSCGQKAVAGLASIKKYEVSRENATKVAFAAIQGTAAAFLVYKGAAQLKGVVTR